MNQPSVFQAQHPLSPRKFWKKMFPHPMIIFPIAIIFIVFWGSLKNLTSSPNNVSIVFSLTILIPFVILILLRIWYIKVYIRRYYYDCADQFVIIQKGVFAPTEIHVQYQKIQDVYVDQDIIDRMMGLYDVHIASATVTSGIEAHIDGVNKEVAESLKNIILEKIHNGNNVTNMTQIPISQPTSNEVQLNQKISSETYPISKNWIWSVIISALFSSLFWFFIVVFVLGKMVIKNNSVPVNHGFSDWYYWYFAIIPVIFFYKIIKNFIWKDNFYFEFTPDYILFRTGIISKQENHLPYKSIQNILNSQGVVDRILGMSTVIVQNAAQQVIMSGGRMTMVNSNVNLVWQPKEKAEELNRILNDIVIKINPKNPNNIMGL